MKLSFAIPKDLDAMPLSEFEEYVSAVGAMGYKAVEPLINNPVGVDQEGVRRILDHHGLELSGLRSGSVYAKNGWCLSSPDEANRTKAVQRLKDIIALAGTFHTNVMLGLLQGHLAPGESLEQAEELIAAGLRECAEFAASCHVTILYEAVNRFELEYHNTIEEAISMLERMNRGLSCPVKLLPDVFHMHLEDPSVPSALIRSMPYMGHVHFADSNRRAPGEGSIDFVEVIKDLAAMGYDGYAAVEVEARPSILGSAQNAINYLGPIMAAVGTY